TAAALGTVRTGVGLTAPAADRHRGTAAACLGDGQRLGTGGERVRRPAAVRARERRGSGLQVVRVRGTAVVGDRDRGAAVAQVLGGGAAARPGLGAAAAR